MEEDNRANHDVDNKKELRQVRRSKKRTFFEFDTEIVSHFRDSKKELFREDAVGQTAPRHSRSSSRKRLFNRGVNKNKDDASVTEGVGPDIEGALKKEPISIEPGDNSTIGVDPVDHFEH